MRLKIALRNLVISQIIILLFLLYAWFVWFPHSFTQLGGFYKTAGMLVLADLVLGPLLVFIVFKEGKKYLAFDINVLLSIQIFAFVLGAYSLFLKHPAYAVFKGDRFILTNVSHLYPRQHWFDQIKTSFFSFPKLVVAQFPDDPKAQMQLALDIDIGGAPDIDKRPEYFKPFVQGVRDVFHKSITLDLLFQDESTVKKFNRFYKKYGGKPEDYAYFPLSGNNKKDVIWVFRRSTAEPVAIIDADPWIILASKD